MQNGQGALDTLRRALDGARRTAQAHLEAVAEVERAVEEYEAQVAQDQRMLADEREELLQERVALENDRRDVKWDGMDQVLPTEEAPPFGQPEGGDFEEPPTETGHLDEGGPPPTRRQPDAGPRGASRSRSRSPHGSPRGREVAALARRLGLDEKSSRQIQTFPPDEALRMLEQVGDGVRNPSAFIMKMCQRASQPPTEALPSDSDRVEALIREFNLDDSAARTIREMPVDTALGILEQVDAGLRNPSAFVMSQAFRGGKGGGDRGDRGDRGRDRERGGSGQSWGKPLEERIRDRTRQLALDGTAVRMLEDLLPEDAWDVLTQVTEDVRNPSAFVTKEVRKINPSAGSSKGGGAAPAAVTKHVSSQIELVATQLQLDDTCITALHEVDQQDALKILERLSGDLSNIRNRSAFVLSEIKKRKSAVPVRTETRRAPCSKVPCKFFAKGQCKNGASCRFSHD